jgi:ribonucleoside-diphosphate reductase alpha chain
MTAEEWLNGNELSVNIFNKKYRNNGESLEEFFERVGHGYSPIIELIKEKKFLFGGRILANRGVSGRNVSLSNCYVLPRPEDNLESIFDIASKMARTFSFGGGCGIDLSNLRPKGAVTHNAAKESTGPVSFMDLYSQVTQTISQAGRRGATMISLDINHPDIEEFINCKTDLDRVKYANISVRVNDQFMKAVENDEDYILKWPCDADVHTDVNVLEYNKLVSIAEGKAYIKKVKAKELFTKLAKNNWDYAEPGILYWDRISNYNLLNNTDFRYAGTNPCRLKCRA